MAIVKAMATVTGLEGVKRALKELEPKVFKKVISDASKRVMTIGKDYIKPTLPKGPTGELRRSVRVRVAKGPKGSKRGTISYAVLVGSSQQTKRQKSKGIKAPWWAYLVEWGWTLGKRVRVGKRVVYRHKVKGGNRKIAGRHLVKHALTALEPLIRDEFNQLVINGVEKELGNK